LKARPGGRASKRRSRMFTHDAIVRALRTLATVYLLFTAARLG
jgi:hypothetical protein